MFTQCTNVGLDVTCRVCGAHALDTIPGEILRDQAVSRPERGDSVGEGVAESGGGFPRRLPRPGAGWRGCWDPSRSGRSRGTPTRSASPAGLVGFRVEYGGWQTLALDAVAHAFDEPAWDAYRASVATLGGGWTGSRPLPQRRLPHAAGTGRPRRRRRTGGRPVVRR